MSNSLAGVWHEVSGRFNFHIAGSEPSYSFETRSLGHITEQGLIERLPNGDYLAQGHGVNGPLRIRFTRPQPDHLHGRLDIGLDALAPLIGQFTQLVDQFLPSVTLVRRSRPAPPPLRQPRQASPAQPQRQEQQKKKGDERKRGAPAEPDPIVVAVTDLLVDRAEADLGIDPEGEEHLRQRLEDAAFKACRELEHRDETRVELPFFAGTRTFTTRLTRQDLGALIPDRRASSHKKQPPAPPSPGPEKETTPLEELDALIGIEPVKEQVRRLDAWAWLQRQLIDKGKPAKAHSLHMCFAGPPGTGKTTVARIVGRLLKEAGLLSRSEVAEVARPDLIAEFVGQTAPKTSKVIRDAIGGVLFIDEAYALTEPGVGRGADFGGEALAVLIAEMENRRNELCVIVAGYADEMGRFLDANAGMASRISRRIAFPDFTDDELCEIFKKMLESDDRTCDESVLPLLRSYVKTAKENLPPRKWGNARSVRNILEAGIENQALRLRRLGNRASLDFLLHLEAEDFGFLREPEIAVY